MSSRLALMRNLRVWKYCLDYSAWMAQVIFCNLEWTEPFNSRKCPISVLERVRFLLQNDKSHIISCDCWIWDFGKIDVINIPNNKISRNVHLCSIHFQLPTNVPLKTRKGFIKVALQTFMGKSSPEIHKHYTDSLQWKRILIVHIWFDPKKTSNNNSHWWRNSSWKKL